MPNYDSAAYTALPSDLVAALMDQYDAPGGAVDDLADEVDERDNWHVREGRARRAILSNGHAWWVLAVEERAWGTVRSLRAYRTLGEADEAVGWSRGPDETAHYRCEGW